MRAFGCLLILAEILLIRCNTPRPLPGIPAMAQSTSVLDPSSRVCCSSGRVVRRLRDFVIA